MACLLFGVAECCSELQCVAVCYSVCMCHINQSLHRSLYKAGSLRHLCVCVYVCVCVCVYVYVYVYVCETEKERKKGKKTERKKERKKDRQYGTLRDKASQKRNNMGACVCEGVSGEKEGIEERYGVATISRLLKMIGLFCKRAL